MILSRDVSVIIEWAFFALTVAVSVTIANGIRAVASRQRRARRATVAIIAVGVWLVAAAWVRIHTGFGVVVLQGADHWVAVAMAQEDGLATETLARVIQSSNYGVNAAEKAALKLPAPQQMRALTLLAAVVPWDNWKETYRERAHAARSRIY